MKTKGSNLPKVKKLNRASILETIYEYGPLPRTEIAERLGLTLPTITTAIAELIDKGVIREVEKDRDDFTVALGRKAAFVDFVSDAFYIIGIEWISTKNYYCICNLSGKIVYQETLKGYGEDYDKNFAQAVSEVERMTKENKIPRAKIMGIGVVIAGLIDSDNQIIRFGSVTGWRNKQIGKELSEATGFPVLLESHGRARAIAIQLFERMKLPEMYAYCFARYGVTCIMMTNGEPMKCGNYGAGELGHMMIKEDGPVCVCGRRGCLQTLVGEMSIEKRCADLMEEGAAPVLRKLTGSKNHPDMEDILKSVECGDEEVARIVGEAGKYLGISIANLINFLSPGLILIEAALMDSEEARKRLTDAVEKHIFPFQKEDIHLKFIKANPYHGARGGCAVVIKKLFLEGAM